MPITIRGMETIPYTANHTHTCTLQNASFPIACGKKKGGGGCSVDTVIATNASVKLFCEQTSTSSKRYINEDTNENRK